MGGSRCSTGTASSACIRSPIRTRSGWPSPLTVDQADLDYHVDSLEEVLDRNRRFTRLTPSTMRIVRSAQRKRRTASTRLPPWPRGEGPGHPIEICFRAIGSVLGSPEATAALVEVYQSNRRRLGAAMKAYLVALHHRQSLQLEVHIRVPAHIHDHLFDRPSREPKRRLIYRLGHGPTRVFPDV